MAAGQATTKPMEVSYFHITNCEDMEVALESAVYLGMHGTISGGFNREGAVEWKMEIVDLQGTSVAARIGDVYIWDSIKLISITLNEFTLRYTLI